MFSITIRTFETLWIALTVARAAVSAPPPSEAFTIQVTGRVGSQAAWDSGATSNGNPNKASPINKALLRDCVCLSMKFFLP